MSDSVEYVFGCLAALDNYELEELANEISPNSSELAYDLIDAACSYAIEFGPNQEFARTVKNYRTSQSRQIKSEIDDLTSEFDEPAVRERLACEKAPLPSRKRIFVSLWDSFEQSAKLAFLARTDPNGTFRKALD